LKLYLKQGVIKNLKTEKTKYGIGIKKYYILTSLGYDLLKLLEKINDRLK
jgi:hypothetical protein